MMADGYSENATAGFVATEDLFSRSDIDDWFSTMPIGSLDKAIANNIYGVNHRQMGGALPSNQDQYGLTFFTRPQMNLQEDNLRNNRILFPLLNIEEMSVQRAVRCLLDPRLIYGYQMGSREPVVPISCPIVDNEMPFFAALTNNLERISGWPDIVSPTWVSQPDLLGGVQSYVDGPTVYNESFDLDCSFRNTKGDIILYMCYIWQRYMSAVFMGTAIPYLDMLVEREIDYSTRIYRLVLDKQRNRVVKIAATNASYPVSSPMGSFFDFDRSKPYNDQNKEITIRFKCDGVTYMDDILIYEFNKTVQIFNPAMRDAQRPSQMAKLSKAAAVGSNWRGYPRIDPSTYELEWYVNTGTAAWKEKSEKIQSRVGSLTDLLGESGD